MGELSKAQMGPINPALFKCFRVPLISAILIGYVITSDLLTWPRQVVLGLSLGSYILVFTPQVRSDL